MKYKRTYGNLACYKSRNPASPADLSTAMTCSTRGHDLCSRHRKAMNNWTSLTIPCMGSPSTVHIPLVQAEAQYQAGPQVAVVVSRCTARSRGRTVHNQLQAALYNCRKRCGRYHMMCQSIVSMPSSRMCVSRSASNLRNQNKQFSHQHVQCPLLSHHFLPNYGKL